MYQYYQYRHDTNLLTVKTHQIARGWLKCLNLYVQGKWDSPFGLNYM